MLEVYFGILICLADQKCQAKEIISDKAHFSLMECEKDRRLIAQAMFIKTGIKYGYKCVKSEYEPPKLQ